MNRGTGTIVSWDDSRGYGFIEPSAGGRQLFLHIRDFSRQHRRPQKGLPVDFTISADSRGRPRAVRVRPRRGHRRPVTAGGRPGRTVLLCLVFYVVLSALVFAGKLPPLVPFWFVALGLLTFALYAKDKSAARNGHWRTPENTLHLLSLAGGWTGALVAREMFRHKTSKVSFRVLFWLTVLGNLAALAWLLSPSGSAALAQVWEVWRALESVTG
ncbi:DUF1294 domain-containing protein [Microbulbifer sediminum]|uniref:DUF1294 domain-containing protein n=1 Tax=Microbulbifer sediminum TaxID=2904250 RepID=UPI001F42F667|nr:DUF1294 domain-containing protein [Microbulbifer sediminum]